MAVSAVGASAIALAASALGFLVVLDAAGPAAVALGITGAALPCVAGGVLVAGAIQHGRRRHEAELRFGVASLEQGAQAGLTLRF